MVSIASGFLLPGSSVTMILLDSARLDGAELLALESVVSPSVNHHDYTSTNSDRIQSVRTWEGFRVLSGPTANLKHSLSLDIYETIRLFGGLGFNNNVQPVFQVFQPQFERPCYCSSKNALLD